MHIVRDPDAETALAFLRSELQALRTRRGHLVQVLGGCIVDYSGRAASTLDQGERLILMKPDGTFLVHTAQKAKPVNWMPPGPNETSVTLDDGHVVLSILRHKPHKEVVRVRFLDIRLLVALPLRDSEELVLRRTEGDLHRLFYEHPELVEEGLVVHRGEKATRRGPLDLWGIDRDGHRVIIEVKRSKGGIGEATQLWRYVEMERNGRFDEPDGTDTRSRNGDAAATGKTTGKATGTANGKATGTATGSANGNGKQNGRVPRVRGILVCPGISEKAAQMLTDHGLEHKDIDWDDLLAHLEAPRAVGQATLGRFSMGLKPEVREKTVRTGKRRG